MKLLKALVIYPNERADDVNSILHIAGSEIQKREHIHKHVKIKALKFIPECQVFVVLYETPRCSKGLEQDPRKVNY